MKKIRGALYLFSIIAIINFLNKYTSFSEIIKTGSPKVEINEEAVEKAKKLGQKLLVEVKLHGKEPKDIANIVVNKFKELGIEKQYMIVSLDLKLVEEIKKIDGVNNVITILPL